MSARKCIIRSLRLYAVAIALLTAAALPPQAQETLGAPAKAAPLRPGPHVIVMAEQVVLNQWPHTLKLANAPQQISVVNPGECVRVGIFAPREQRNTSLTETRLGFRVNFAGRKETYRTAPLAAIKEIRPGDENPASAPWNSGDNAKSVAVYALLGASAARWCVPADAPDGTATIDARADDPGGHTRLPPVTIQVESFETGSKHAFKDAQELSSFSMAYYREPEPARLLPALQYFVSDSQISSNPGIAESIAAFLSAALRANPVAASDFKVRVAAEPPMTRAFGLVILRSAGYDISDAVKNLNADEQKKLDSIPPLADPFEIPMTKAAFTHLDTLWAVFGATGSFAPVSKIAGMLAWRPDYEAFSQLRNSGKKLSESDLTPSMVRGLIYVAAGWSLSSFQANDPLVADYIDYMLVSPDVADPVKTELKGLQTNPVFHGAAR